MYRGAVGFAAEVMEPAFEFTDHVPFQKIMSRFLRGTEGGEKEPLFPRRNLSKNGKTVAILLEYFTVMV